MSGLLCGWVGVGLPTFCLERLSCGVVTERFPSARHSAFMPRVSLLPACSPKTACESVEESPGDFCFFWAKGELVAPQGIKDSIPIALL